MFGVAKAKNPGAEAAHKIYALLLARAREEKFYTDYKVPDSFDGRFDLLLLHLFLVINRLVGEGEAGREFNQVLFDITFMDMDQTLREMGIGDMGLPKHMRRMMKAFNGRMQNYQTGWEQGEEAFKEALKRNLYATAEQQGEAPLDLMYDYVEKNIHFLKGQDAVDMMQGELALTQIQG